MTRRRAILLYAAVIALPASVLLLFGIQSFERQRKAVSALMRSNARLSGERLVSELENRTAQLAQACLREAARAGRSPGDLESARQRHGVAGCLFLFQGGRVLYPPLHTPAPHTLDEVLAGEPSAARSGYADRFHEAEEEEFRRQNYAAALSAYRKAGSTANSAAPRALAQFRAARCLAKMNRLSEAKQAYEALAAAYPDLTDLAHRPYALLSATALQPGGAVQPRIWADVLRGRWLLSGEQFEYYAARIGDGLEPPKDSYAARLKFARELEEGFRPAATPPDGDVYALALPGSSHQVFYASAGPSAEALLAGLAVNMDWIKDVLLPQCRTQLHLVESVRIIPKSEAPGGENEERLGFPSLFPGWALVTEDPAGLSGGPGLLFQAATTVLVLGLLLIGLLMIVRDLSREARTNRLRADFVGAISHELKTPITLIRLYGETLLDDEDFTSGQRREFYEIITRESERLTHLIEKVLHFSRIERGEKQYRLQSGDLGLVIQRTVEAYEPYLKRRGFSIATSLAAALPPVRFDGDAVSQALVNLVDNALKYSGEVKAVAIRSYTRPGAVVLEVEDRGIGIPRQECQKIFERFYRVKNGCATGGYGLGLYLVRHIMDAHGGIVEVESELGRGSRFGLIFPAIAETS